MRPQHLKIIVCLFWTLGSVLLFSQMFSAASSRERAGSLDNTIRSNPKPEGAMIDRFDKVIQQRFLTVPLLGINRITPPFPPNPHLREFYPTNEEERNSVADFEKAGWKVDLYLFGRRAEPKVVDGKLQKQFTINYRLNKPVAITSNLEEKHLPSAKQLLKEVKVAFQEFQTPNSPNENNYEFSVGSWSYVARPVKASSASCLRCHTDYVIASKVGDNKYQFRRRKVGDVNGVLVYGFGKTR